MAHILIKHIMQDRKKDIKPINDKGQARGYWESYYSNEILFNKCFYINDIEYGYEELLRYKLYHAK
jgi:hypothetical protein